MEEAEKAEATLFCPFRPFRSFRLFSTAYVNAASAGVTAASFRSPVRIRKT
jgi:hypothetical protein